MKFWGVVLFVVLFGCSDPEGSSVGVGDTGDDNNAADMGPNNDNNTADTGGENNDNNPPGDMAMPDDMGGDMSMPEDMSGDDMALDMGIDAANDMADMPDMMPPMLPIAAYPTNGADWNDYVIADGTNPLDATDTACGPAARNLCSSRTRRGAGGPLCLHGGEMRQIALPYTSCNGVTLSDSRNAFDWVCDDAGAVVRAVSTGLSGNRGLSSLLDWSGAAPVWFEMSLIADGPEGTFNSAPAVWWNNPIVVDNDGGNLDAAGTIYVVTATNANDYNITAERVALLTSDQGVMIGGSDTNANVVSSVDFPYTWFEVQIDATGDSSGLYALGNHFAVIRNTFVSGATQHGIAADAVGMRINNVLAMDNGGGGLRVSASCSAINGVTARQNGRGVELLVGSRSTQEHITLRNVEVERSAGAGVVLSGLQQSRVENVQSSVSQMQGIRLTDVDDSVLVNLLASTNFSQGIVVDLSLRNVFYGIRSVNNDAVGLGSQSGDNTFVDVLVANNGDINPGGIGNQNGGQWYAAVTAANNLNNGFGVGNVAAPGNTVMNAAVVNVAGGSSANGFDSANGLGGHTFINIAAGATQGTDILMSSVTGVRFTGEVFTSDPSECIGSGTSPGITTPCGNADASDATYTQIGFDNVFIGKAATDAVNPTQGTAMFGLLQDVVNFENDHRTWGQDGSAFPAADHVRACRGNDVCVIWDYRLAATGGLVDVVDLPASGDDTSDHLWSASTQADRDLIDGANWNGTSCTSTFLEGAAEIPLDSVGNDNGLCESGEDCLALRNIGAYQGSGMLVQTGTIGAGGTVENITLYEWDAN